MTTEIRVPTLGESVTQATVAKWFKSEGEPVKVDEPLCELETDKVTVEVPAPAGGVLSDIRVKEGETVEVGSVLGAIREGNGAALEKPKPAAAPARPAPAAQAPKAEPPKPAPAPIAAAREERMLMPSAARMAEERGVEPSTIEATGKGGRITKGDVMAALEARARPTPREEMQLPAERPRGAREERVPMTRLRRTIALRLKAAQNTAAMLTTFNEVDMGAIMALRNEYKEPFEKRHGVKLGFMSFFVKACIQALKEFPAVNAEIEGDDIIYKSYYDIGVAVGTERGLIVPVLRDADALSMAEIERTIHDFGIRARDGKLKIEELQGGTFTITNGGVFGSLLSTPILNAPQSGILGMHKIEQRPVVVDGKIEIRPMMYLALTYDHRIVDGREAVTFLVRVKESLEGPQRLLLGL
jgi:2-oxoglutarate dehydrogenase E2 component (dihydrolipoamide succinyltransferase)